MGQVSTELDRSGVLEALRAANPTAPLGRLVMYADAFCEYRTAQKNIAENGTIVFHPRTGAPISNPYMVIRDAASSRMLKLVVKADCVWSLPNA